MTVCVSGDNSVFVEKAPVQQATSSEEKSHKADLKGAHKRKRAEEKAEEKDAMKQQVLEAQRSSRCPGMYKKILARYEKETDHDQLVKMVQDVLNSDTIVTYSMSTKPGEHESGLVSNATGTLYDQSTIQLTFPESGYALKHGNTPPRYVSSKQIEYIIWCQQRKAVTGSKILPQESEASMIILGTAEGHAKYPSMQ